VSTPVIIYILECKHVSPGRIGVMQVRCHNCDAVKNIIDVHTFEWRVWCKQCNYKPWCGLSQILANQTASGHSRKHSLHEVKVLYMENPVAVRVQTKIKDGV
jgi:hypothetical protein